MARFEKLGRSATRGRLIYTFIKACFLVVGSLAMVAASLFGFGPTQGLLDLREQPREVEFSRISSEKWLKGQVLDLRGARFERIETVRNYNLGWLRNARGDDSAEVVVWADRETALDGDRFVVERIDPHELLRAQQEALETVHPASEWDRLIVVETFEVKVIPAIAIGLIGLILAVAAVWKARVTWRELKESSSPA